MPLSVCGVQLSFTSELFGVDREAEGVTDG